MMTFGQSHLLVFLTFHSDTSISQKHNTKYPKWLHMGIIEPEAIFSKTRQFQLVFNGGNKIFSSSTYKKTKIGNWFLPSFRKWCFFGNVAFFFFGSLFLLYQYNRDNSVTYLILCNRHQMMIFIYFTMQLENSNKLASNTITC